MKIEELSELVLPGGLFRTGQILAGQRSPQDVRRQIDRWVKRGRILKLRRGVYMLVKPYVELTAHPFLVANTLKRASYVSLQSALAHYGLIPEYVPVITSITTGRPEEVETPVGRFQFRHVAPRLFYGFTEIEISRNQPILLAAPQKAIIDLLYMTPSSDEIEYIRELRLRRPEHFNIADLQKSAERSGSSKVKRSVDRLNKLWELDGSDETTSD